MPVAGGKFPPKNFPTGVSEPLPLKRQPLTTRGFSVSIRVESDLDIERLKILRVLTPFMVGGYQIYLKDVMNVFERVDTETGEILLHTEYQGRSQNGRDWWIMYRTVMAFFASGRVTYSGIRVYMHITAKADWRGVLASTKTAIAKEIGVSVQSVCNAISELKHYDLIRETKERGVPVFVVNPAYATLGKDKRKRLKAFAELPHVEDYVRWDCEDEIASSF